MEPKCYVVIIVYPVTTFLCAFRFKGQIEIIGKFASASNEYTGLDHQHSSCTSDFNGDIFLPGSTLKMTIVANNLGNPKHFVTMPHPGEGSCLRFDWVSFSFRF